LRTILLSILLFSLLMACQKQEPIVPVLSPTLYSMSHNRDVDDTVLVFNRHENYQLDVDEDGIPDLSFSLTHQKAQLLDSLSLWVKCLDPNAQLQSTQVRDTICRDSVYIALYLFYIYRYKSCTAGDGLSFERVDSTHYAGLMDKLDVFRLGQPMENPDSALIYYIHDSRPTVEPGMISYTIEKGPMRNRLHGYLLLETALGTKFAVEVEWAYPYFLIGEVFEL